MTSFSANWLIFGGAPFKLLWWPDRRLHRTWAYPKPIRIRQSQYLNNHIEQHYRRIKCRVRSTLGIKS
jgi:transposase-like protein